MRANLKRNVDQGVSDRQLYQKQYYDERKSEISQKRRDRYNTDPEYRASVIQRAIEFRRKKQEKRKAMIESGKIPPRKPREVRVESVNVGGHTYDTVGIRGVAERLNRSVPTLNNWIARGIIPKTPFIQDGTGYRMYTQDMIHAIKVEMSKRGTLTEGDGAYEAILEAWKRIGVYA